MVEISADTTMLRKDTAQLQTNVQENKDGIQKLTTQVNDIAEDNKKNTVQLNEKMEEQNEKLAQLGGEMKETKRIIEERLASSPAHPPNQ